MSNQTLKKLVRIKYDYQEMRIRTSNRLALNKKEEPQQKEMANIPIEEIPELIDIKDTTKALEAKIDKSIAECLKGNPIYEGFLKGVKGVEPVMAGVLLSEIDLEEATTVSKIWQYAGLNSNLVRGRRKVDGKIIKTEEYIKGDRATSGYLIPYNKFLKTKLMGVLADSFIKSRSPYSVYYYNYKQRLENSAKEYRTGRPWKDETKAHRNMAAKRYMVKMFLKDYYKFGREILNLPVRMPYQEEYLGHKHDE